MINNNHNYTIYILIIFTVSIYSDLTNCSTLHNTLQLDTSKWRLKLIRSDEPEGGNIWLKY